MMPASRTQSYEKSRFLLPLFLFNFAKYGMCHPVPWETKTCAVNGQKEGAEDEEQTDRDDPGRTEKGGGRNRIAEICRWPDCPVAVCQEGPPDRGHDGHLEGRPEEAFGKI